MHVSPTLKLRGEISFFNRAVTGRSISAEGRRTDERGVRVPSLGERERLSVVDRGETWSRFSLDEPGASNLKRGEGVGWRGFLLGLCCLLS